MADAKPAPPPRQKMSLVTIGGIVLVFYIMFNPGLRDGIGRYMDYIFGPVMGFGGKFPILTIALAGCLVVILTTLLRHFTTDWLEMAKIQAYMRHFNAERMKATKENNTYKLKVLNEKMPEIRAQQQKMSSAQFKQMPLTMLVSLPVFFWLLYFLQKLDYTFFAAPWNRHVTMFGADGILFGSSVFPHWILLQIALTIPFGLLVQRVMKYIAWRERWQKRHPEVSE